MSQIGMFFNGWEPVARIIIVGTLAYFSLVILLRVTNKRTLAQLSAFDFIVTVAIGASFGRVLTARQVALSEAITAFALLVFLQYAVTWLQSRFKGLSKVVTAPPTLLYFQDKFVRENMLAQRVTESELQSIVRRSGSGSLEDVEAIVLESSGKFSVIKKQKSGDKSLLEFAD